MDLPTAIEGAHLLSEEMLMVVGEEHPLRGADSVTLAQFFTQELALFRLGFYHREHMEALAQKFGVEPDIAFESNLIPLLKAVVRQGFAVNTFIADGVGGGGGLVRRAFRSSVFFLISA